MYKLTLASSNAESQHEPVYQSTAGPAQAGQPANWPMYDTGDCHSVTQGTVKNWQGTQALLLVL
jgi:hypothetical protein